MTIQVDAGGSPLSLPGTVAATRWVGGTSSGAPVSGTFAVGDFVVDQTGLVWICTVAGSPGTWRSWAADLAHAEINANSAGVTSAAAVAITGLSIAPDCPGSAIRLKVNGTILRTASTGTALCFGRIYENSVAGTLVAQQTLYMPNVANQTGRFTIDHKVTPSAGVHTYIFALATSAAYTAVCVGSATEPFCISAHNT